MCPTKSLVTLVAIALVAAAVAPAAVSAAPTVQTTVEQNPETGAAVVTVLQNDTAVENATVEVTSEGNYSGTGNYSTDANGTIELPEPAETVSVNLTVTVDGRSSTTGEELYPRVESLDTYVEQADDGTATVTVTQYGDVVENASVAVTADGNYSATGDYRTDANGHVELAQPNETQNVTVTATYDDLSAEFAAELVGENELTLAVEQADDGTATVTVTRNDAAVENATVEVAADGNYSETGTHSTDVDGTVALDAPQNNVTVTVTATEGGDDATEIVELVGAEARLRVGVEQQSAGVAVEVTRNDTGVANATVEVAADGNYSGTGTYRTGDDGTVDLPAPTENVTVTVSASSEGDEATVTETLTTEFVEEQKNFGQAVFRFVEALRTAGFDGPPGQIVSDFVTSHNPGNADDARENAPGQAKKGNADANATDEDEKRGRPDEAGKKGNEKTVDEKKGNAKDDKRDEKDDKRNGKKNGGSDSDDGDDDSDDSNDDSDGGKQGPPDRAKNGK